MSRADHRRKIGIYQSYWGPVGGGQRYVGVVAEVLARSHDVEIVHHAADFDRPRVEEALQIDLSAVRFRHVPRLGRPAWRARTPWGRLRLEREWRREISEPYDVFIDSSDTPPCFCHARYGVLLIHFPLMTYEEFHGHTSDAWQRRPAPVRWLGAFVHRWEWRRRFAGYQLCLVNSHFTKTWIKRLWGLEASVVYPPLRGGFEPRAKEDLVLSIGAFHRAEHKRHDVLLDAYKDLCNRGVKGWRYVMAGACGTAPEDRAYVERLRQTGRGYPIEVRTDVSGAALKELLESASVVWHSMGYGVDPEREPRRMEHFGMVATEAMAAGCVPVVFDGGGLREIVTHERDGFRWRTVDELVTTTQRVAEDASLRRQVAAAARRRATDFGPEAFEHRLLGALAPVLGAA